MQKSTVIPLILYLRISAFSFFLFITGCSVFVGEQDSCELSVLTSVDENALYQDLWSRHPDHENLALPDRGNIKSTRGAELIWVVWMTESSPIGEGIIGTYDAHHKLRSMRVTRPIKHIGKTNLNEDIDVLLIRELSATGTGLYEETMSILDIADINVPLWSGKVYSWLEGLEGRNEGYLMHCIVSLHDLSGDETKDLLVTRIEQTGADLESVVFSRRNVEYLVFAFDTKNRKFCAKKEMCPETLYPLRSNGKENF